MTRTIMIFICIITGLVCAVLLFGGVYHILHSPNYIYQYKRTTVWWNLAGEEVKTEVEYFDPTGGETLCYISAVAAGLVLGLLPKIFLQHKIKTTTK